MNKAELVDDIYENLDRDVTKKDIAKIVNNLFTTIQDQVASGKKVTIVGFGSFAKRDRAARRGRNPRTNEPMTIPAMSVPAFSAGKDFKDLVERG
jgi:DNA-binding protein HU-beta